MADYYTHTHTWLSYKLWMNFYELFYVLFQGVVNCIGGVLDGMLKNKKGHIINISSDAGRVVSVFYCMNHYLTGCKKKSVITFLISELSPKE